MSITYPSTANPASRVVRFRTMSRFLLTKSSLVSLLIGILVKLCQG